ncbi:MAG: hypothetical protein ACRD10_09300 [Terriglobia bacterium]
MTVGKRKLEHGKVEIFDRSTKQVQDVNLQDVRAALVETLHAGKTGEPSVRTRSTI